jgi:uncharacterized protein YfaS (alpha-2-macroglobulin family)
MWDFARPSLYNNLEDKLAERFTATRDYNGKQPGKPTYDSVDVGQYLQDKSQARRGLFLLHLSARGTLQSPEAVEEDDEEERIRQMAAETVEDTRLILVTDLGFIVKQAKDGSRDVFVQSIRSGMPVEGARIDLVGSNGLPMLSATSDATGRATLPKPSPFEATREKTPQLILVEKDGDLSFMPFAASGRQLSVSRFDTGGVENAESAQQLSAYVFTDRGIYRPGETIHLGLITRTADWKTR